MKLTYPFDKSTIAQRFGENANPLYSGQGLKGHTGIDFGVPWGTPIPNSVDSYCAGTANRDISDLMLYRAVYTYYDEPDSLDSYEISYGHCSDISVVEKAQHAQGEILANVGNTGEVFVGQHEVTQQEKLNGSHAGAHLHFQVRKLLRTTVKPTGPAIYDAYGLFQRNGYYYLIPDYANGYNGCVSPEQFLPFTGFDHNLWFGKKDIDNIQLQMRLGVSPTDQNFGPKTLSAVINYQKANGITPTGFVGSITRTSLNKL